MAQQKERRAAPAGKRRPTEGEMRDVLLKISEGISLRKACEEAGLDPSSTYKALTSEPELRQQYTGARAMGGDYYAAQVANVAAGVLAQKIEPDRARVAIDAFKWTAARMAPKTWGDKLAHVGGDEDDAPIRSEVVVRFVRPGAPKPDDGGAE